MTRGINFIFKEDEKQLEYSCDDSSDDTRKNSLLTKYVSYDELMEGFRHFGLEDKEINMYFKLHKAPFAQALLRYVEDNIAKIKNTKAYIIKGLKYGYDELENDKRYYSVE